MKVLPYIVCKRVARLVAGQDGKANKRSEILVRQIGHSEQASEQDLQTVQKRDFVIFFGYF